MKEQFLKNLENAMTQVVCKRLYANEDAQTQKAMEDSVREFVRENAAQYSMEELMETFTTAESALGLFLEYLDAKRLCEGRSTSGAE